MLFCFVAGFQMKEIIQFVSESLNGFKDKVSIVSLCPSIIGLSEESLKLFSKF